ncbi:DEAD/DEAH box helicase [Micromonospora endophytica]|uniref:RNA helicase n=1 Tax=Micromonospora endophytica TaxID=515350 RepID=A0A2W2BEH3_9ACTN|nr:DEAD/DEAH box helicase [Micromonospora endophytica]PZF86011.1 RNA helicase [Micromonospora endophytica]RIW51311.1 DEAD/DEAH box helicase [Micromonospora endophytica]BCJ61977.1 RNA helicase [Micromonospora endophytica]
MAARRPRQTTSSESLTFADLGVPDALNRVLAASGVQRPFPIQAATLPDALAGRDVLGRGRTGSGKTYAFVLAVLTRLAATPTPRRPGRPRALILAPTRELATQIDSVMAPLAQALSLRTMTVFGGVAARPQIAGLRAGVDVLVACPGRLADHVETGHAILDGVEITVLDEADHMADLGFLPTVRRLMERTPRDGQRLLFSATLDAGVDVLVRRFLTDPVVHSVDSTLSPVAAMTHHVLHVQTDDRFAVLVELTAAPGRTVVFTRTKRGAKTLTRRLVAAGVTAVELHGNLAQGARTRNLQAFSDGAAHTLVATDIAARGIHIDDVALVVHADPPVEHKAYLHRSGRTARAGAAGTVVTLMTDGQVPEVRELTRKAGITATTTRLRPGDTLLRELAPGERTLVPAPTPTPAPRATSTRREAQGTSTRRETQAAQGGRGRRGGNPTQAATTRSAPTRSGAAAFSARARPSARRGVR